MLIFAYMLLIHNATFPDGSRGWLSADGAMIAARGAGDAPAHLLDDADETVDARGALLMPGVIDAHVHFREPGLTAKATIASESAAALAGGVTSYIDMPNTVPPTVTIDAWADKMERAAQSSASNYAFMLGATSGNLAELQRADYSYVAAVKVFMGSSTGNMLLDGDSPLRAVFADQPGRIVVHAEDQAVIDSNMRRFAPLPHPSDMMWHTRIRSTEACVRATERAMQLASRYGSLLHVAHVTTAAETALFDHSPTPAGKQITAEVSPHHLLHCCDDYGRLGSRIKMNPSVKTAADRDALRRALLDGRIDIIATDHAPHLPADKAGDVLHAASGAPMAQFSLTAMLDIFDPATVAMRMAEAPARLFGIHGRGRLEPGCYADLVLVERLDSPHTITDADVLSLCGWTPLAGRQTHHRVARTWVNGGTGPMPLRFGL